MREILMPIRDVEKAVGRKKSTIYARIAKGVFPKPAVTVGQNLWREADIEDYNIQMINTGYWEPAQEAA